MNKSRIKRIVALLIATVSAFSFAGCASWGDDTSDTGGGAIVTPGPDDIGGNDDTTGDNEGGETTDPDQGGETTDPDQGGETTDPDQGGETTDPDQGGETTDPDQGGETTDPDQGGETTDPDQGGETTDPDQGGETTDPDQGGETTDPDQGGETTDPDQGGETTDPDQGGETTDPDQGGETTDPDQGGETTDPDQGGETTDPDQGGETTNPDPDESLDPDKPNPPITGDEDDEPVIPVPVAGAVEIIKVAGDLEAAYVTWEIDENVKWYNVYCKAADAADSTYVKLDGPLVRKYSTYFRADAVGLAAGRYTLKVVPVDSNDNELMEYASEASATVIAHDRSGFAFVNGTSSGAYNEDGTLKANADVIYVTEENKDTIELSIDGADSNPTKGIQYIIEEYKNNSKAAPLAVRFIGNITDFAYMNKGDFLVDDVSAGLTIEGIGSDATANGWGLRIKNSTNVEVRNLGFMNCDSGEGDNVGLQQGNDHIWVHNCDLFYGDAGSDADQVKGDGALDTKTSTYITHSYNHFWDSGKCNLQGMKSEKTTNYITYHHNWYDHSDSRHPRIRTCTVHIYNNYFDGNAKYGVGVTMGASAFVENNYFRSEATQKPMMSSGQGTDAAGEGTFSGENGGIIKSFGNVYAGSGKVSLITYQQNNTSFDVYEASSRDEKVPSSVKTLSGGTTYNNFDTDASLMYDYEVQSAEDAKKTVEKYAGRIDGGDLKYDFNDAVEDGNYIVIDELKQMLVNYKSDLVQIGGGSVIEGSGTGDGGSSGGDGTGDGGSSEGGTTGGDSGSSGCQTGGGSIVEGSTVVTFEKGAKYSNTVVNGVTITGNASDSKGSMNVGGTTYSVCLKMESSTKISFTPAENMTMTLYLQGDDNKSASGSKIDINGELLAVQANGTVTIELTANTLYTIQKENSMNLFAIVLTPVA